jgi:nucleoside-diphosphate-sugar epimerase
MEILITGSEGLIGSHLMMRLKKEHNVYGIDLGDTYDEVESEHIDVVIHCAAHCIIRDVIAHPVYAMDNIRSTLQALEFAREKNAKFIYFSSSRVSHTENNPYIASKRAGEEMVKAYHDCYDIDYIIIRPETVWGHKNDNKKRVIPAWINRIKSNETVIVYGDKRKELPPIHVDDFVDIFMKIFNKFEKYKGRELSISGKILKVPNILKDIGKYYNKRLQVVYLNPEKTQPQRCRRADFVATTPFIEQLKRG